MRTSIIQYSPARAWSALLIPIFAILVLIFAAWNAPVENVFSSKGLFVLIMMTGAILFWHYVLGPDAVQVLDLKHSEVYIADNILYFSMEQAYLEDIVSIEVRNRAPRHPEIVVMAKNGATANIVTAFQALGKTKSAAQIASELRKAIGITPPN